KTAKRFPPFRTLPQHVCLLVDKAAPLSTLPAGGIVGASSLAMLAARRTALRQQAGSYSLAPVFSAAVNLRRCFPAPSPPPAVAARNPATAPWNSGSPAHG